MSRHQHAKKEKKGINFMREISPHEVNSFTESKIEGWFYDLHQRAQYQFLVEASLRHLLLHVYQKYRGEWSRLRPKRAHSLVRKALKWQSSKATWNCRSEKCKQYPAPSHGPGGSAEVSGGSTSIRCWRYQKRGDTLGNQSPVLT